MNLEQIISVNWNNEELSKELKEKLTSFLVEGSDQILDLNNIPEKKVSDTLEQIIGRDITNVDSNGWQHDYWYRFKYKEKKFCYSGTGAYGTGNLYMED